MVPASDKHYTARNLERRDLSEDLWVIRVDPGGPFQFKAGQYATLGWTGDKRIERAYSIVSSPYEEGREFFIELAPQGELTPQKYDLFKIGWSHLGNPGVVVGSEARFLLQDMNLAFHLRHLVV
jgi:ferredoxin-NADP reductase